MESWHNQQYSYSLIFNNLWFNCLRNRLKKAVPIHADVTGFDISYRGDYVADMPDI